MLGEERTPKLRWWKKKKKKKKKKNGEGRREISWGRKRGKERENGSQKINRV